MRTLALFISTYEIRVGTEIRLCLSAGKESASIISSERAVAARVVQGVSSLEAHWASILSSILACPGDELLYSHYVNYERHKEKSEGFKLYRCFERSRGVTCSWLQLNYPRPSVEDPRGLLEHIPIKTNPSAQTGRSRVFLLHRTSAKQSNNIARTACRRGRAGRRWERHRQVPV